MWRPGYPVKTAPYLAVALPPSPPPFPSGRCDTALVSGSNALGEFLRGRRGRLRPEQVGLPGSAGRRRTPGLRREELAALAGLSIDYYIRLEQGRECNPSPAVVAGLAKALRLDADEQAHLLALTHHAAGRVPPAAVPAGTTVRAAVRDLLERLRPCPALVLGRASDVLAANPEGLALYAGLSAWPESTRNTVRYVFTHPAARDLFVDWDAAAATTVANLRSRMATGPDAADVLALRDELCGSSGEFLRLWNRYDVQPRRTAVKRFHHPVVGDLELVHETLHLRETHQRLSLYQPERGSDHERAVNLLSISTQLLDPAMDRTGPI